MFRPLKRLNLGNLVPLPGVGELESAVKGLIDAMKSSGYKNEQCDLIATRFERLLGILRPAGQLEGVQTVLRQLGDIKDTMEAGLKRKLPAGLGRAQHQLEVLDTARNQINDLITDTLLQLSVLREIDSSNQIRKKRFEENLRIIPEYEILNQELVRSVTTRTILDNHMGGPSFEAIGNLNDSVTICYRTGHFGNLRVSYRTFSSHSDDAAAERVGMELKVLSKALHPCVATVVGVTRGYYGLNGIVVAMAGLSHTEFILRDVSGAAVARCIKEMQEVSNLLRSSYFGEHIDTFHVEGANIDHNGHVTVLPRPRKDRFVNSTRSVWINPREALRPPYRSDKSFGLAYKIYFWLSNLDIAMEDFPLSAYRATDQMRRFINRISGLNAGFTKLDVVKIATEERIDPAVRSERLRFDRPPPFAVMHGDIICPAENAEYTRRWHVFEEGNELSMDCGTRILTEQESWKLSCEKSLGKDEKYSTWLTDDYEIEFYSTTCAERTTWREVLRKIKHAPKFQCIDTKMLSFCHAIDLTVKIRRPKHIESVANYPRQLYFHRNQSDRSSPRHFWGFFSADPDPYASFTRLEDLGWTFEYDVNLILKHYREDWERIYERIQEVEAADIWEKDVWDYDGYKSGVESEEEEESDEEPLDR